MVGVFLQNHCGFTRREKANRGWSILLTICWALPYCMYIKFMRRPIKWLMEFDCWGNEPWQMKGCPNGWTTSATEPERLMEGDGTCRLCSKSASWAAIFCLHGGRISYLTGMKSVLRTSTQQKSELKLTWIHNVFISIHFMSAVWITVGCFYFRIDPDEGWLLLNAQTEVIVAYLIWLHMTNKLDWLIDWHRKQG